MAEWWSIEVFSGDKLPASGWRYAYEDELTEAAITHGAMYYEWHDTEYGVIFEVLFRDDEQWEAFRALPAVRAALDGVPDPVNGLLIYRGRGGASGGRKPQQAQARARRRRARARGAARGAAWIKVPAQAQVQRRRRRTWTTLLRELGIGAPGQDGPAPTRPAPRRPAPSGCPG